MLFKAFKPFPNILISNENLSLKYFIEWHKNTHQKLKEEGGETVERLTVLARILDLQKLFLDYSLYSSSTQLPEYDLQISTEMLPYDEYLDIPTLKELMSKVTSGNEVVSNIEVAKLEYMMNLLDTLQL